MGIGDLLYKNNWVIQALSYMVSFIFGVSAILKTIYFNDTLNYFNNIFCLGLLIIKLILVFLIFLELIVTFTMALKTNIPNIFYIGIIVLLLFFSAISIGFIITDIDNCACFGTILPVKPLPTIIKNFTLITIILILRNTAQRNDHDS